MYGPKGPFLLRYGSRDMRQIDFPRVDGLLTDTPVLGRHKSCPWVIVHKDTGLVLPLGCSPKRHRVGSTLGCKSQKTWDKTSPWVIVPE